MIGTSISRFNILRLPLPSGQTSDTVLIISFMSSLELDSGIQKTPFLVCDRLHRGYATGMVLYPSSVPFKVPALPPYLKQTDSEYRKTCGGGPRTFRYIDHVLIPRISETPVL